jgi:hypothetical protein
MQIIVKVPKLRTGSGVRSAFIAAIRMVAPMTIAAVFGWTTAIVRRILSADCSDSSPILQLRGKGWAALLINFLNGIAGRRHHRAQQPMDNVFLRGTMPPKSRRPLPSTKRIDLNRFYAHRRMLSEMVFPKFGFRLNGIPN